MEPTQAKVSRTVRNAHIAYEYAVWHLPLRDIATRHHLSHVRIRKIALALGVEMRRPGRPEKGLPRYG